MLALWAARGPLIAGALALALVLALAAAKFEGHRVDVAQAERDVARLEVQRLGVALKGADDTVAGLRAAVDRWQALATPASAVVDAAERVQAAAVVLEARSTARTLAEVADHAKPDCAALLALDIARACPAYAVGVRARARDGIPRPAGRGAGAGGAAVARATD